MLFRITATRADNGWSVELTDEANEPLRAQPGGAPLPPRPLGCRPAGGAYAFPLPPADDPSAPGSPEARLLAEDGGLSACFALIARQTPGSGDVERFGRYLFHTLIGPRSWAAIKSAAGGQPLELALCWDAGERCLARLPWEMMARPKPEHPAGSVFLAADEPLVAITRRVPGRAVLPAQLQTPPRVLFVVGTALGEQVIRSGAEYLGLLRALESNDLGLRHQLLAQASPERLKAAIAFFRPSILHFICHGGVYSDSGQPFLDLRSDDPAGGVKEVTADDLLTILAAGPEVEAVVLNACYTASAGDYSAVGQVALPMAEALVAGDGARSVPIVVGMAGEIGDRACRLFTRRFYETLLSGGSIAQATAQGRRLGLTNPHSDEWLTSLDWALPTLFLPASAGEATLAVADDPDERVRQRNAGRFRHGEYPVFCGREDHFDAYAALMGDDRLQRLSRSPSDLRLLAGLADNTVYSALALSAEWGTPPPPRPPDELRPRIGLSWLLGELAATAFRDGHLPVILSEQPLGDLRVAPKDPRDLLKKLRQAARRSADVLGLPLPESWEGLRECLRWDPAKPVPGVLARPELSCLEVVEDESPSHEDVLAEVFWLAMRDLLAAMRSARPAASQAKLLLIVDDLDYMEQSAAVYMLAKLLHKDILWAPWFRDGVRAIVGYSRRHDPQAKAIYEQVISPWEAKGPIRGGRLTEFEPGEGRRAYRQFLLGWREDNKAGRPLLPLTNRKRDAGEVEPLFSSFHKHVTRGVPSYLLDPNTLEKVDWLRDLQQLIPADDSALINDQAPAAGGGA